MDHDEAFMEPLKIKNYQPDGWTTWYHEFRLHTSVKPFEELGDEKKVKILLRNLGEEVTPILDTFGVDLVSISYDELVRCLKRYFQPAKARNVFLNSKQKSWETFEQFESRLKLLSGPCGYGPFCDDFARDVFLNNIDCKYSNVRNKILESYADPKFSEVVDIAKKLLLEEGSMRSPVISTQSSSHYSAGTQQNLNHEASQGYYCTRNVVRQARHSYELYDISSMISSSIEVGNEAEVLITGVYNNVFHVNVTCPEEKVQQLQRLLNESLNKNSTLVSVEKYKMCVVKFDEMWYRVIVLTINGKKRTAFVQSMDFGWKKTIAFTEFRVIPPDFVGRVLKVTFLEPIITLTVGERVCLSFIDKTTNEIWTVKLANGQHFKNQLQDSRSTDDRSSSTDYDTKGKGMGENYGNKRDQNHGINNLRIGGQQLRKSKDLNLRSTYDTESKGNRGGREQHYRRGHNEDFYSKRGGQNERGRDGFNNKGPDGGHNEGGKNFFWSSFNRKRQEFDRNGDGSRFKNESETTDRMPNGRHRNNDGSQRMYDGNRGTKNGNERGSGNNRHSGGGERGNSGHTQSSAISDPMSEFNKLHLVDNLSIPNGPFIRVIVMCTIRNRIVCVQPESSRVEFLDMTAQLQKIFEDSSNRIVLPNPKKGMYCVAPYDGKFHRAEIREVKQSDAKVFFYDYGNDQVMPCKDLLALPKNLSQVPFSFLIKVPNSFDFSSLLDLAIIEIRLKCMDADGLWVVDVGGCNRASSSSCSSVTPSCRTSNEHSGHRENVGVQSFKAKSPGQRPGVQSESAAHPENVEAQGFKGKSPGQLPGVQSESAVHPENVESQGLKGKSPGQLPGVQSGSAAHRENAEARGFKSKSPVQMPGVPNGNAAHNENVEAQGFKSRTPGQMSGVKRGSPAGGHSISGRSHSTKASKTQPVDDAPMGSLKPPIPMNEFTEVRVIYSGSEGTFVAPHDALDSMMAIIGAVGEAAQDKSPCSTPIIKNVYAAPYEGEIFRAKVLTIDRCKSTCQVEFIDFGNQCHVSISDLIELPAELTERVFIFKARLDPRNDFVLQESMDVKISPISVDADGCWLVQLAT